MTTDRPAADLPELIIEAGRADRNYWGDLWRYRELFWFLAWRDVTVRYKQTAIGIAWAVLRPVLSMLVFALVFGKLAKLPSGDVPYPLLVLAGMLPWQFFSGTFADAANSLIVNANMIAKVYFPRIVVPTGAVFVNLVDFLAAALVLVGMLIFYRVLPGWQVLYLPIFFAAGAAAALGIGLWFAALNIKYRDFRYLIPFVTQFGLYLSPVGFSSALVPDEWRILYALNPMVGVIDGFRWGLLGADGEFAWRTFAVSGGVALVLLGSGIAFFRRHERSMADSL